MRVPLLLTLPVLLSACFLPQTYTAQPSSSNAPLSAGLSIAAD